MGKLAARHAPLLAVLALATLLRVWGISFGLPHTLTRPDEEAVLSIALRFFGRDLNPGFFDWPSLFMYIVAAGFIAYFNIGRLAGWFPYESTFVAAAATHPAPLQLIARGMSATAGVTTVWAVHRLGTLLFDATTGLVGALFLAVAALHVRDSHFGMTDVPATCALTLSFLYTMKAVRSGASRHLLLSGILAGLAASTKYNAGLIVLPAVVAILAGFVPGVERWTTRLRAFATYGATAAAAFIVGTPFVVLDPAAFVAALRNISSHLSGGHTALAGYGWEVHLASSLRFGLGEPLLLAGVIGLVLFFRQDWRRALLFALFPVSYYALIGSGQTTFARYIIPVIPFLCLAAAHTTSELARLLARSSGLPSWTTRATWILAAAIAITPAYAVIQSDSLLARPDNRLIAAEWVHERFPAGARIHQAGAIYTWVQMQTSDPAAAQHFVDVPFDESRGEFLKPDRSPAEPPDMVIVSECPLAYCTSSSALRATLARDYRVERTFEALNTSSADLVYDRDDAFFVPLAGFSDASRPGPNLTIYVRRETGR